MQVLVRVGRGRQHRGELAVARMGDEPGSQVGQREGNAVAKSIEGTSAVSNGGGAPLLEPAAVGREGCGFRCLRHCLRPDRVHSHRLRSQ